MPDTVLWARNETKTTITFNTTYLNWELPPYPDPNYIALLPWEVATANGFDRLWGSGKITVALDRDFQFIVTELPDVSGYRPFVYQQDIPQATTVIQHDLNRQGPVMATVTSLDGAIEYFNVIVDVIDNNNCRISLDDPVSFLATIF